MAEDGEPEPDPPAKEAPLEGVDTLALRIDWDLVSDWSPVVERIARTYAERVVTGIEGRSLVVKLAIRPERRGAFEADMNRYWEAFVERRKREGRWK